MDLLRRALANLPLTEEVGAALDEYEAADKERERAYSIWQEAERRCRAKREALEQAISTGPPEKR